MTMPVSPTERLNRADLAVAIFSFLISICLLFIARPIVAQTTTFTDPAVPNNQLAPLNTYNPSRTATPGSTTQNNRSSSTYLNPTATPTINPGSSQSQRDANARQPGTNLNNPQLQPLPECRIEDTACIEQRNQLNPTNPQTAPTFNR